MVGGKKESDPHTLIAEWHPNPGWKPVQEGDVENVGEIFDPSITTVDFTKRAVVRNRGNDGEAGKSIRLWEANKD